MWPEQTVLRYLRGLVVYWQKCNIETDSSSSSAMLTGHRQHKLNMLRIRPNILERRHISHFHVVYSMLVKRKNTVSNCMPLNGQTVRNEFFFFTCVKSLSTGALASLASFEMLSTRNNRPASAPLEILNSQTFFLITGR